MHVSATIRKISSYADEIYGPHVNLVRVAIVQKEFYDDDNNLHESVLVELLPTGSGNVVQTIPEDFAVNDEINIESEWVPNVSTIGNDFKIVVYVQAVWGIDEIQQVWFDDIPASSLPQFATSTESASVTETLNVYPNPARDKVYLVSPGEINKNITWTIYSASGQVVKQGVILPDETQTAITVSDIVSGLYVIELKDKDGKQFNQQLSILH